MEASIEYSGRTFYNDRHCISDHNSFSDSMLMCMINACDTLCKESLRDGK
jgi:hypothetical protein